MAADTSISAADFMKIRAAVAGKLKESGSRSQIHEKMAEELMLAGYIDMDAVLEPIRKVEAQRLERERVERERLAAARNKAPVVNKA